MDEKDKALIAANKRIMELERALVRAEATMRNVKQRLLAETNTLFEAVTEANLVTDPRKPT